MRLVKSRMESLLRSFLLYVVERWVREPLQDIGNVSMMNGTDPGYLQVRLWLYELQDYQYDPPNLFAASKVPKTS